MSTYQVYKQSKSLCSSGGKWRYLHDHDLLIEVIPSSISFLSQQTPSSAVNLLFCLIWPSGETRLSAKVCFFRRKQEVLRPSMFLHSAPSDLHQPLANRGTHQFWDFFVRRSLKTLSLIHLYVWKQISIPYLSVQEVEAITLKTWKRRILSFYLRNSSIQAELVLLSYSIDYLKVMPYLQWGCLPSTVCSCLHYRHRTITQPSIHLSMLPSQVKTRVKPEVVKSVFCSLCKTYMLGI